jgi:hypothetical protein
MRPLPSHQTGLSRLPEPLFPMCRAHYPVGSSGCACRLLPRSRVLRRTDDKRDEFASSHTLRYAILTIFPWREAVETGGLMSYGANFADGYHQVGIYGRLWEFVGTACEKPVIRYARNQRQRARYRAANGVGQCRGCALSRQRKSESAVALPLLVLRFNALGSAWV